MTQTSAKRISHSPEETARFGQLIGKVARPGDVISLIGDLGAGKTQLVKGIARGMGVAESEVTSPTFPLLNIYEGPLTLYHIDLYRWEGASVGLEDVLEWGGVSVVEWADHGAGLLGEPTLTVTLKDVGENRREISFVGDLPLALDALKIG
jgi:tRNA threonylcarbamoyladenosine biosynthesis protein TsaE